MQRSARAPSWRLAGLVVGPAAIVLLLLGASSVAAAIPHGMLLPPYKWTPNAGKSTYNLCGTHGKVSAPQLPFANKTTGAVGFAIRASASGKLVQCGIQADAQVGFLSPVFKISANATHKMVFHWLLSWNATLNATSAGGGAFASAYVEVDTTLWEVANGSYNGVNGSGTFLFNGYSNAGTGGLSSQGINQSLTLYLNASMVKGHSYSIDARILAFLDVGCPRGFFHLNSCPSTVAHATIDMGTHGNGARLVSMKIS